MALTNHIVPDSPTNNFATLNPLENPWFTHSNGNLATVRNGTSNGSWRACSSSIAVESDIWYYELLVSHGEIMAGVFSEDVNIFAANQPQDSQNSLGMVLYEGQSSSSSRIRVDSTFPSNISEWAAANTIIGFLVDFTNTTFKVYFNGTLKHTASFSSSVIVGKKNKIVIVSYSGTSNGSFYLNFGQDPTFAGSKSPTTTYTDAEGIGAFYYDPTAIDSEALALCTANLPDMTPTVDDTPQDYFKAVIWTGQTNAGVYNNGNVTVGFQPDLVWIKDRTSTTPNYNHQLYDSLRGSNSGLIVNENYAATNYSAFSSFDSNGFTVPNALGTNTSSANMVAWCWKAGDAPTASDDGTGVSGSAKLVDTSGAASSTTCKSFKDAAVTAGASNVICPSKMSINQAAGFSIIKYNTGQTGHLTGGPYSIPHGLGAEPKFIIIKSIDNAFDWMVYHRSVANVNYTQLNASNAFSLSDSNTYSGSNTEYVVNIGGTQVIAADGDYIMYSWSPVEGYSKFGSYVGNGSADGPFVYCGFRPAWVMVKWISGGGISSGSWRIMDTARNLYNPATFDLLADDTITDTTLGGDDLDILSNGFKWRGTGSYNNYDTASYIYMAFAEQPFKYSNAR